MAKKKIRLWTPAEDRVFFDVIEEVIVKKSGTLNDVFVQVGEKLARTVPGCQFRYTKKIKHQLAPEVLEKIRSNNPAVNPPLSGGIGQAAKEVASSLESDFYPQDFSDVQLLVKELVAIENRRKEIKEKLRVYNEYISGLIGNS